MIHSTNILHALIGELVIKLLITGDSAEYTSKLLEFLSGNWFKKYHDEDEHRGE
jgi:hypothetical protein